MVTLTEEVKNTVCCRYINGVLHLSDSKVVNNVEDSAFPVN